MFDTTRQSQNTSLRDGMILLAVIAAISAPAVLSYARGVQPLSSEWVTAQRQSLNVTVQR